MNLLSKISFFTVFTLSACGGSSYLPNQSYQGTASGASNFAATLSWAVNTDYNTENVTGVFDPIGSAEPISLQGDLSQGGTLTATGGSYTFNGTVANGILSGTFTGPNQGNFSTLLSTENTITSYCGTFTGSQSGVWTLQSSNNNQATASSITNEGSTSLNYSGTFSGNMFSLSNGSATASGIRNDSTIEGTWSDGNGNSGTFSVSQSACE